VFFFSVAYTQKSYKLTYDKLNDNWSMYENKFSKGKYILTPLKNKPKLKLESFYLNRSFLVIDFFETFI
jgi:hypothetical protein